MESRLISKLFRTSTKVFFCLIFLTACSISSSSSSENANSVLILAQSGGSVSSPDGKLTLEIPPGALSEDTEVSISPTTVYELSPETAALADKYGGLPEGTPSYHLEPSGLEFDQPVTISVELDAQEISSDLQQNGLAVPYLILQSQDGSVEFLDDLNVEASLDEETVVVSGTLEHFSLVTRTKSFFEVYLTQVEPKQQLVGDIFEIDTQIFNTNTDVIGYKSVSGELTVSANLIIFDPAGSKTQNFAVSGGVAPGNIVITEFQLYCQLPGLASYSLLVTATENDPDAEDPDAVKPFRISLTGVVECVEPSATPTFTNAPLPTEGALTANTVVETSNGYIWQDGLNDGIECRTGEPLAGTTPPEIDIGAVTVEWLDNETLMFTIEFPRMETLDQPILGSFEFDNPAVPNSNPSDTWFFAGLGEADGNYYFQPPDPIFTEAYTYDPVEGWVEHTRMTITAETVSNQVHLIVPIENFPYLQPPIQEDIIVWTGVTTPELDVCDAALWDDEGTPAGWIPPLPGP